MHSCESTVVKGCLHTHHSVVEPIRERVALDGEHVLDIKPLAGVLNWVAAIRMRIFDATARVSLPTKLNRVVQQVQTSLRFA